ncbi:zinc finger MYM-type protein 1-like [Rhipicephalus sanguineus]|uniref:zinc finger MYM-type protein 1-like n=1 Tax=Rhipicephalus sanguineus TaxID=34632 RepID=UPI0020C2147E|nr:zinc finger MYM-type protein 1-like [Rhipicephalus sanguineus]
MHMDSECDELSASWAARDEPDSATEFTASVDADHAGQLDISKFKAEQPTQPILNPFPSKKYGKLSRSFNSDWYRLFPWLEYSARADAAFCYPCRMFSTGANEKSAFVNGGYSNWKKALEKDAGFRKHENSLAHKTCQASWVSYTQMKSGGQSKSVASHLSDAYSREVQENRLYIARVADILRFTAVQGIAQRGHDEGATSENKGNFVELLNLFAKYDEIVAKKLKGGAANAKYVHHSIQDQILEILSHITLTSIKEEIKSSQCFALIVDETKDLSKTEQVSVVVRYYVSGTVFERFLGFRNAEQLDARSLLSYVKETLNRCGIDAQLCIAQTYDGASVMSGTSRGVQALFRQEVPQAVYVHCMNHRLNLVIVDVCKAIKPVRDFFSLLECLYVFLSGSAVHSMYVDVQKRLSLSVTELQRLSDTRWACQIAACRAAMKSFPAILVCLAEVIATNSRRATEARGLLEQMNFSFLFHLSLFTKVLSRLKVLSDLLQSRDCNLSQACIMARTVIDEFSEMRNSQSAFDTVWAQTCSISEENGVPQREKQRTKRLPLHLEQFVLSEGRPVEEESPDSKETFRVKVFLPVLDHLIAELTRRFTENNDVLCGVSALHPQSENFMDISLLKPFAEHYACDIDSVEVECKLVIKLLQRIEAERKCKIETLMQLVTVLGEYKLAFHELHKLGVIAVTIPASSSSCERTFSCLRRLKTYLRSRMTNNRLSDLAVLAVERSLSNKIDLQRVVDMFDAAHSNRRIRLH